MNALNILCLQIKWREFIIEVLQAHRYDEEEGERFGAAEKKTHQKREVLSLLRESYHSADLEIFTKFKSR